ncbi:MAG TPA: hypothetical protein VKY89_24310 [Thermoanaerobaculia bacterium]|nr:hypothetical protein [Thermoanaerobaculia bacterium]
MAEETAASSARPGEIITFYSYKGGTGRSMAVANVGYILSKGAVLPRGVLLIDWDLEAPGLHRYFADRFQKKLSLVTGIDQKPGLIDFFVAADAAYKKAGSTVVQGGAESTGNSEQQRSILDADPYAEVRAAVLASLVDFVLPVDDQGLFLLKAGKFDVTYPDRIREFDWEGFHRRDPRFFGDLRLSLMARYDYVLIDSRTGLTDTAGICAQQMPEKLVLVFVPNHQSLDGVLDVARRARRHRLGSSDLRPLVSFPLVSRIDGKAQRLRNTWRRGGTTATEAVTGYQKLFEDLFIEIYELDECDLEAYFDTTQIPHESEFAYGEQIAARAGTTDNLSLGYSYANFSRRLTTLAAPWEPLPEEQELEEVKRSARVETALALRKTRIVRWISVAATVAALIAAALVVGSSRKANVEHLRAEKVLSAVAASPDPLEKALLLGELQDAEEPPGGLAVAREVASTPLPAAVLGGASRAISGIAFSPAGDRIAELAGDQTVRLFKADGTGDPALSQVKGDIATVFAFSTTGQLLVVGAADGTVSTLPAAGGVTTLRGRVDGPILAVSFDTGDNQVLVATGQGVTTIDQAGKAQNPFPPTALTGCDFAPRANRMVAISEGDRVVTWDLLSPDLVDEGIMIRKAAGTGLLLSDDGRLLITSTPEGTALWELTPNGIKKELFGSVKRAGDAFALSPDGRLFAYPAPDGSVVVRTVDSLRSNDPTGKGWQLRGQRAPIRAMALNNLHQLVTGAEDGSTWVWNLNATYNGNLGWSATLDYLRHASTACLSVSQRKRLLTESDVDAVETAARCEQGHGRTPLGSAAVGTRFNPTSGAPRTGN